MWTGVCVLLAVATCGMVKAELNETQLSQTVTDVSIELFKAVSAGDLQNRVVAPLSVNILLALLEQGARGQSSLQLRTALRLGHDQLREGYGGLARHLQRSESDDVQLEVASRMFVGDGFPIQEDFLQTATRDFSSGVENVTFGSANASAAINNWVAEATRNKITKIVEPDLPAATVMVLANAMYFKSPWLKPFQESDTSENTFKVDSTRNVTVPFMYQQDHFQSGFSDELNVKWLELLFKSGNYSLLVILPTKEFGLADVLANLTSSDVSKMLQDSLWNSVNVYLPRFKLGTESKLVSALKKMGITDIFGEGLSDLSGISSSEEPLSVSDVRQKATMEIDEKGGVAAAATVVGFVALSGTVFLNPEEFRADQPFLALIIDKTKNVPLFMGTVVDPSVV